MNKFFFTLIVAFSVFFFSNCGFLKINNQNSSGKYASETRNDFGFREIKAGKAVVLIISVQEDFGVTVEGEADLLKDVKTEVEGETLIITTKNDKITSNNKMRLRISMPELRRLELWGASEATVTNTKSDKLKLQAGGSSSIKIDGETKSLEAAASGSSKIDAENLKTEKAEANAAGASEVTVSPSNDLIAEALGASTIFYTNEPKNIKQNIVGAGEIRKK